MFVVKEGIILNGFEDICQLISKEDGYDCWRCLVCSKTVIVSCTCNRYTEKIRIIVNGFDNSYQEYQELCILCRCFSMIKKVSVLMDQLLCLPLPLIPSNGFS